MFLIHMNYLTFCLVSFYSTKKVIVSSYLVLVIVRN